MKPSIRAALRLLVKEEIEKVLAESDYDPPSWDKCKACGKNPVDDDNGLCDKCNDRDFDPGDKGHKAIDVTGYSTPESRREDAERHGRFRSRRVSEGVFSDNKAIPSVGDIYVFLSMPEYGGEEADKDVIAAAGDLKEFVDNDEFYWNRSDGPAPGAPGVWISLEGFEDEPVLTFDPGELVRIPAYDKGGTKAWARLRSTVKLRALAKSAKLVTPQDKKILEMLGRVTTYGVPTLNAVRAFSIRLRKDSIGFNYDPYGNGITGAIRLQDLKGTGLKSLEELAQWMFSHGAQKIKPQKRLPNMSYYD